ncbi:hypothetical protein BDB01DRAFT_834128 [Pilobolus umbonatus]|nr:hypothetical protein BDB01DRAFT_834128 [Pilobolus umbonatus]
MNQFAAENNFFLVTSKLNKTQLHLRCEKGGCYENKGLSPENGQRNKGGGVPQIIHSKKKIWFQQVEVAKAISPLIISKIMFETPSRITQNNISHGSKFNKLTIDDINNLKYNTVDRKNMLLSDIYKLMHRPSLEDYQRYNDKVDKFLKDTRNFVAESAQLQMLKYYLNEWKYKQEYWTAYHAGGIKHFGCCSTQKAESGHSSLKRGIARILPLELAFDKIDEFEELIQDIQNVFAKYKNHKDQSAYNNEDSVQLLGYNEVKKSEGFPKPFRPSSLPSDIANTGYKQKYNMHTFSKQNDIDIAESSDNDCSIINLAIQDSQKRKFEDTCIYDCVPEKKMKESSFKIHLRIAKVVKEAYDSLSDDHCGYRAVSYLHFGDKNICVEEKLLVRCEEVERECGEWICWLNNSHQLYGLSHQIVHKCFFCSFPSTNIIFVSVQVIEKSDINFKCPYMLHQLFMLNQ